MFITLLGQLSELDELDPGGSVEFGKFVWRCLVFDFIRIITKIKVEKNTTIDTNEISAISNGLNETCSMVSEF